MTNQILIALVLLSSQNLQAGTRCGQVMSQPVEFSPTTFHGSLQMRAAELCGGGITLNDVKNKRDLRFENGKLCLRITSDVTSPEIMEQFKKFMDKDREPMSCSGLSDCMNKHRDWYRSMVNDLPELKNNCNANLWDGCAKVVEELEEPLKGKYFDILFKNSKCKKTISQCGSELQGHFRSSLESKDLTQEQRDKFNAACDLDANYKQHRSCDERLRQINYGGGAKKEYNVCEGDKVSDEAGLKSAMTIKNKEGGVVGQMKFDDGRLVVSSVGADGRPAKDKANLVVSLSEQSFSFKGYSKPGGDLIADLETAVTKDCPRQRRGSASAADSIDIYGMRGSSFSPAGCGTSGGLLLEPLNKSGKPADDDDSEKRGVREGR